MDTILFALWFFLPAGAANAAPVLANNIPLLKSFTTPIDFGKSFRGKRILGDHKTYRGIISGVLFGTAVAGLQMMLVKIIPWLGELSDTVDYTSISTLFLGASLGFGALAGDAVKSFFKRQYNVASGGSWFPFDQVDYIIGGLVASRLFVSLSLTTYITILVVWFVIHPVANIIGWLLHLKSKPF